MNVAGLDLSMTATGVTHTRKVTGEACTHTVKPKTDGDERLITICNELRVFLEQSFPMDLVLVEDLPVNARAAGITGMVHGAVRSMLLEYNHRYAVVPPASVKKYATGKGNATKIDMAVAAMKRAGLEFADDNACDSWWLWAMATDYLGKPVLTLPAVQHDQLKNIKVRS